MASLSDIDIINQNPIDDKLNDAREKFRQKSQIMGFETPFVAIQSIANGGVQKHPNGGLPLITDPIEALSELPAALSLSRRGAGQSLAKDLRELAQCHIRKLDIRIFAPFLGVFIDDDAPDLSIWDEASSLVSWVASNQKTSETSEALLTTQYYSRDSFVPRQLQGDWAGDYFPGSLAALTSLIGDFEKESSHKNHTRTLVFAQSSGMGKLRLVDAFGKTCPMISFVLREKGTQGFPPANTEVLSCLRRPPPVTFLPVTANSASEKVYWSVETIWSHIVALGLIQACFEIFREWVKEKSLKKMGLKELATKRHQEMAGNSSIVANCYNRSGNRVEFCEKVVARVGEIANKLAMSQDWRKAFEGTESGDCVNLDESFHKSGVLKDLLKAATRLQEAILEVTSEDTGRDRSPFLMIALDEAESLLTVSGEVQLGPYIAFQRIMRYLKEFEVWLFILSAESELSVLFPPRNTGRDPPPLLPSPFLAFQLDIEDRRRMKDQGTRNSELHKPMSRFLEPGHMAMFGRPLWFALSNANAINTDVIDPNTTISNEIHRLAKLKLVGSQHDTKYDPKNKHHVFASMSSRLCLDVCIPNPKSLHCARSAFDSDMRVVISVDQNTGVLDTVIPSEPVLAVAAMTYLCTGSNWPLSIETLIAVLEKGRMDKGLIGELFSRIVLTLAHDLVRMPKFLEPGSNRKGWPLLAPTIRVIDLLRALYAKKYHESIDLLPSEIRGAWMNFTHFVPAGENLSPDAGVISGLCHDLLRRSAALQLAPNQPTYNKLLPIYFGKENEDFDESQYGVILVQDKNKETATTPEQVFSEGFQVRVVEGGLKPKGKSTTTQWPQGKRARDSEKRFVFGEMKYPILFILLDVGILKATPETAFRVSVSEIGEPQVWAIHSRGHTEEIFGCLKDMKCDSVSEKFFPRPKEMEKTAHDKLVERNRVFNRLCRKDRYEGFEDSGGPGVEIKDMDGW